jgi:hypothetical protein
MTHAEVHDVRRDEGSEVLEMARPLPVLGHKEMKLPRGQPEEFSRREPEVNACLGPESVPELPVF